MKRKKLALALFAFLCFFNAKTYADLSPYDQNKPVGWATVEATPTGGEGGDCVTVTTAAEIKANLAKKGPLTIYVQGAVEFTSLMKVVAVDKTLIGLPGSKLYSNKREKSTSGILYFSRNSHNVILRNITFASAGAYDCDGSDNLCIDGAYNIWIDHCDFQDGVDGNFDCKNGSNNIAVTWCRFRYLKAPLAGGAGGSGDHRFSNLWGSSDDNAAKDQGKLNTTFQFCWWDEGCRERMPRVRFGKVHVVNCLYSSSVANYCIGAGNNSSIYVEKTVFSGVNNPYCDYSNAKGAKGLLTFDNCKFDRCSGNVWGTGGAFQPWQHYYLPSIDVNMVEQVVKSPYNGAGATLQFSGCPIPEPEVPVEPEQPTEPETPIVPEQPETPSEPETPTEPETPSQPETPAVEPTLTKRGAGSSSQEIELGQPIVSFGYSWTDAETIVFEGLPAGVNVTKTNEANRLDVSGTPTEAGTFKFTVKTVGGSTEVSKSGTIIVKEEPTGIEELGNNANFRIAQNGNQLIVRLKHQGESEIRIYSIDGKLMKQIRQNCNGTDAIEIDASTFANGTYIVKCLTSNGAFESQTVIR